MIITLINANFSQNNIGTLDSYSVRTSGSHFTFSGASSIKKDELPDTYTGTITTTANYVLTSVVVKIGNTQFSSDTYTTESATTTHAISIPKANLTGNILITVGTYGEGSGGGSEGDDDTTDPTPDGTSINVLNLNDSDLVWGVTTEAGNTTGEFKADNSRGVSGYIAVNVGDVIRGGTYRNTTNTDGTNYYPYKSSPVYWYDTNKTFLGATPSNPCFVESSTGSNDFILTVPTSPAGIAYFRVMINKSYNTNIVTINNPIPEKYIAYPNPTVLEGTISAPSSTINVFNSADTITTVTMDTSGTAEDFKAQSERGVSGFISCSGGDIIRGATYRSGQTSTDTNSECYPFKSSPVYFYDSALNYMTRIDTFTGSGYDYKMTAPMGASYFRVMINTTYLNTEVVTVNNDLPETFIAYSAT